jgi:hypothetical protein
MIIIHVKPRQATGSSSWIITFIGSFNSPFEKVKMQNTPKTLASTYYLLPLYDANKNYLTIPKK